jgi:hypothetical protein
MVIFMAETGKTAEEIADAVEDRWRIDYPASNNAVPNGALAAIGVWFGEGDFLKTVNIVYRVADFTDADCNAANAAAVVAAMHGMKCLPRHLVEPLHDRIVGSKMGPVELAPPVDEKISELAQRTARIGEQLLVANGTRIKGQTFIIPIQKPITQRAELFSLGDLTKYWNPEWELERAGHGGAGGGIGGIRGITHLEEDVLATYPRDPVRGVVLRRNIKLSDSPSLSFQAGVDESRAWQLEVYCNNKRMLTKLIEGGAETPSGVRHWQNFEIDLKAFANQDVQIRLYQRVLLKDHIPGNAYWKNLTVK